MKIIGTEEEIRAFQVLAHRGLLNDVVDVDRMLDEDEASYNLKFMDKSIEIEIVETDKNIEDEILGEHISILELPTATFNILQRNDITTVSELMEKRVSDVKRMRGLGAKQLEFLLETLDSKGLKMKY